MDTTPDFGSWAASLLPIYKAKEKAVKQQEGDLILPKKPGRPASKPGDPHLCSRCRKEPKVVYPSGTSSWCAACHREAKRAHHRKNAAIAKAEKEALDAQTF